MRVTTRVTFDIETGEELERHSYKYDGPVAHCKASSAEKQAATSNQNFTDQLRTMFGNEYGTGSATENYLSNQLKGMVANGQAGYGFTPGELNAMNEQNDQGSAQGAQNAQQALQRQETQSGTGVPTGANLQEQATIDSQAAQARSQGALALQAENGQLARQNVTQGLAGLAGVGSTQMGSANALESGAISNGANSFNEVAQATQPSNFWGNLGTGLLSGAGMAVAGPAGSALGARLGNAFSGQTPYQGPTGGSPELESPDVTAGIG